MLSIYDKNNSDTLHSLFEETYHLLRNVKLKFCTIIRTCTLQSTDMTLQMKNTKEI